MKATLLVIMFIAAISAPAQKTTLALNLEKDKEYLHEMNSKASVIQQVQGNEIKIDMIIGGEMIFMVKEFLPTGYRLDVQYKSLSMEMNSPQGSMKFTSAKKDNPDLLSEIFQNITGSFFEVVMERTGKITSVSGIDGLWEKAISNFPDLPQAQKDQLKAQIMKSYGENAFRGNLEMVTAIFPTKPVAKGDSWTIETNLEAGMGALMKTTYTLSEQKGDTYIIKGVAQITTLDKDAYVQANGMDVKYDLSGSMSTTLTVDKRSGWIIDATIDQTLSGNTMIKPNEQLPEGMTIPMTMKNAMTIKGR
jgi:hypothetical protein